MKKIAIFSLSILIFAGCGSNTQQSSNMANSAQQDSTNSLVASRRSTTDQSRTGTNPQSGTKTKWTQSGEPIDTSSFDAEVEKAEKDLKSKPNDEAAKKTLAEAYVKRGEALTQARQYASALGDYRRALKQDPSNATAKKWIDEIIGIYESINRQYPPEGEEPPPLPFNK